MSTVTHKLSAPIQAHGEEVNELELRRPTVQECRAIKVLPYTIGADGYPVAEVEASAKYIAVCAKIPPTSVNQLALPDLNKLAWLVIGFFLPGDSGESEESSS
ncbi:phage tail assembly protein [Pseudomonas japonica]|uniref:phage tail assembly protein n=1 Tax=Pseudomonas japonica TaxID=256466 RepID=UPI003A8C52AE